MGPTEQHWLEFLNNCPGKCINIMSMLSAHWSVGLFAYSTPPFKLNENLGFSIKLLVQKNRRCKTVFNPCNNYFLTYKEFSLSYFLNVKLNINLSWVRVMNRKPTTTFNTLQNKCYAVQQHSFNYLKGLDLFSLKKIDLCC